MDGNNIEKVGFLSIDNLKLDGNDITSTNTDGNININVSNLHI